MLKGTKKRNYTREFRESAARLVMVQKVPAEKATADVGTPVHALSVWVNPQPRKLWMGPSC